MAGIIRSILNYRMLRQAGKAMSQGITKNESKVTKVVTQQVSKTSTPINFQKPSAQISQTKPSVLSQRQSKTISQVQAQTPKPNIVQAFQKQKIIQIANEQKISDPANALNKIKQLNGSNGTFKYSNSFYTDVEKLATQKSYFPKFSENVSKNLIIKQTQKGDAIQIGSKMYFNNGSNLETLALSPENYERLFPATRFNAKQGNIGNCYFVSGLTDLMSNPKGRCHIYRMFSNDNLGNLYVKTSANKNKILIDSIPENVPHIKNCPGLAAIELAYGVGTKNQNIMKLSEISSKTHLMFEGGWRNSNIGLKSLVSDLDIELHKNMPTKTDKINFINKYANDNKFLKQIAFCKHIPEYNILAGHMYSLKSYNIQNNILTFVNPHRAGIEINLPKDEILKYVCNITAIKV